VISGAAGSVGSIAGQIARHRGARVIGIAGSDEKCRILTDKLGFEGALNYRDPSWEEKLKKLVPNGADIYIDNVGGSITQKVVN